MSILKDRYTLLLNKVPYYRKATYADIYAGKVLSEQGLDTPVTAGPAPEPDVSAQVAANPFTSNVNVDFTSWEDDLQRRLFPFTKSKTGKGTGRGEYSIAALFISKLNPTQYETLKTVSIETVKDTIDNQNFVQGGGKSFDIKLPETDIVYEVKELGTSESVLVGTHGQNAARPLLNLLHKNISELYKKYVKLGTANTLIDPRIGQLLKECHDYFAVKVTELPLGMVFKSVRGRSPKMVELPDLFKKLIIDPAIEDIMTPAALEMQKIYKTNKFDAKVIDSMARSYLDRQEEVTDYKTALSDFILQVSISPFRDPETFKAEVQDYFISGTELNKKILKKSFPVTGVFSVSPDGYTFIGSDDLSSVLQAGPISINAFKISMHDKEAAKI